ncbi:phosphatase PAP2 family protein [Magnetospirillum molischianum]|uniref:Putative Uncharacterized 22.5 kDa protein in cps region n=1 Tax=Magnetospirillum molischianum DSM 120 TaxID=1150626 RepID=H8FWD9_MAGML|nr:phosphatase PAP2 family protein [Magnetospirillum molischianum]CCG42677.1 putative Uncharacterized 22.5 kDa protein in cps region [Magnetospirillum molischianum DSM 120]
MDEAIWRVITDFGDSAVTLSLAVTVAICLAIGGEARAAVRLLLPIALCGAVAGGLKLLFGSCGGAIAGWVQASPSGHVAMSGAVYGTLALLLARPLPLSARWLTAGAAATLVGLIAVSRVIVQAHSVAEVLAGLALGFLAVALYAVLNRDTPPLHLHVRWLLGGCAVVLLSTHGLILPAEVYLRAIAEVIRTAIPGCW